MGVLVLAHPGPLRRGQQGLGRLPGIVQGGIAHLQLILKFMKVPMKFEILWDTLINSYKFGIGRYWQVLAILIIPRVSFGDSFKLMSVYVLASFVHCTFLVSHFPGMNEAQHLQWALHGRGRVKSKVSVPGLESKLILTLPPCYIHLCKWKCCWSSVFFRIVLGVWRISNVQELSLNKLKSESSIISSGSKRCWPLGFAAARDPCLPRVGGSVGSVDPLSTLELGNCWSLLFSPVITSSQHLIKMKRSTWKEDFQLRRPTQKGSQVPEWRVFCRGIKWWNPSIQKTAWSVISAHLSLPQEQSWRRTEQHCWWHCVSIFGVCSLTAPEESGIKQLQAVDHAGMLARDLANMTSHGGRKFSNECFASPRYVETSTKVTLPLHLLPVTDQDHQLPLVSKEHAIMIMKQCIVHQITCYCGVCNKMPENSSNTHHASNSWTTSLATSQRVPTPATFSSRQPSGSGE